MMNFIIKHKQAFIVGAVVLILLVAGGVWFTEQPAGFRWLKMLFNSTVCNQSNRKAF